MEFAYEISDFAFSNRAFELETRVLDLVAPPLWLRHFGSGCYICTPRHENERVRFAKAKFLQDWCSFLRIQPLKKLQILLYLWKATFLHRSSTWRIGYLLDTSLWYCRRLQRSACLHAHAQVLRYCRYFAFTHLSTELPDTFLHGFHARWHFL